jgi:hypothetical protein
VSGLLSRPALRAAAFVVGLALVVAWASLALRIGTRADTIQNMSNILHGQPLVFGEAHSSVHPFYNRILFPSLLLGTSKGIGVLSEGQWYILLRLASCIFGLGAFAWTCRQALQASTARMQFATALMAVATITAFVFPWEDPTDVIDLGAQALAVAAALGGRFVVCLAIAVVFSANRESAAYAGIIWFVLAPGPRSLPRRAAETAVICVASYAVALELRSLVSDLHAKNWWALPHNIESLIAAVRSLAIVGWLGVLAGAMLFLAACVDFRTPLARKFVFLAVVFAVPGLVFGWFEDVRVFLPCYVMLAFAVAAGKET